MLCCVFNKINLFLIFLFEWEGNEGQMQLGYGSCVWGTGRVTACPPGPGGATQRSSTAGIASDQDELHQSGSYGEEDVTQSPPVPGVRL